MKTDFTYMRVKNGRVKFMLLPEATEDGGFDVYLENDNTRILFYKAESFEALLEAYNVFATTFGVLDFRVEHKF
jgi:hypothetical protein